MGNRNDSFHQLSSPPIKDEAKQPQHHLGMMGVDGYKSSAGEVSWTDEWSDFNAQPILAQQPRPAASTPSCCQPQTIPEEPVEMEPTSSCCAPKVTAPFSLLGEARHGNHHPTSQPMEHLSRGQQQGFGNNSFNNATNLGMNFGDPFTFGTGSSFGPGPPGLDFFGELEGREGCGSHIYMPELLNGSSDGHNCHCGENCDCLGCATHPANRTTTEYVRYHNDLASRGYYLPAQVQAPLSTIEQQSLYSIAGTPGQYALPRTTTTHSVQQSQIGPLFNQTYNPAPAYGTSANNIPSWQSGSQLHVLTPTNELQQFHIHTPSQVPPAMPPSSHFHYHNEIQNSHSHSFQGSERKQQLSNATGKSVAKESITFELPQRRLRDSDTAFDHESPSTDDDTSTLSPSSFHIQQFNVPGCNDITGTCQCGEGCKCPGCLTHRGHDKDKDIEVSSESGQSTKQGSSRAGQARELDGFSIDSFHHDAVVPTTVPG
jgi:hypothetical protein